MGKYKRPKKVYLLKFEDDEFEGLEVRATSLPTGKLLNLIRIAVSLPDNIDRNKLDAEQVSMIEELFSGFAKALKSWNLTDEDDDGNEVDVPATKEGLYSQDIDFVMQIISSWMQTIGSVSKDLGKDSNSGPRFPEASLPTVDLSSLSLTS